MTNKKKPTYDWVGLEQEFVTGEIDDLTTFFKAKNISMNTWSRHTSGWLGKHKEFRIRAIQKANEKILNKRSNVLARRYRMGRVMTVKASRAFSKRNLDDKSVTAKDLAAIMETGVKIENEAMGLEQLTNIPGGLAVGIKIEESVDGKTISVMAKAIADAKTTVRAVRPTPLGG